jgi:ribosome biogenesis GTPase / thiamine phosphate phosphatase
LTDREEHLIFEVLFCFKGVYIQGLVYKIESKDYYLLSGQDRIIRCSLRGKFQKDFNLKRDKLYEVDIVVVGDTVEYNLNDDGTGVIEEIFPRRNYISRKAPKIKGSGTRGERLEQKIASNVDNLVIVSSCKSPKFNNRSIDRFIVAAESSHVNCCIVINKTDLDLERLYEGYATVYRDMGYHVFETCAKDLSGFDELKDFLNGHVNLIWGQSGVGKSSILNKLYSNLSLKIGEISTFSSKGKHTTVTSLLIKVDAQTIVIDTPGIREIDPYGIREEDLCHFFRDFKEYINECRFNTCTHQHEPGCAIISAVEEGKIDNERYISYLNILESIEDDMNF